uniref:PHF7/G2E3-like PHD zinc finger domain-containing protein n=1 Tax=Bubo bubo TaxID=30461 RepID=A0A8C0IJ40_BUBBB
FEGKARVDRHPRWKALTEERTLPPAPQRCSFPPAFALSPPACVLCGRAAADPVLCGQKIRIEDFCAHFFCLVSAPGLPPARKLRFDPNDICRTVVRAAHKGQAACAGIFFNCPLCRDKHAFLLDMLTMGIRIPLRLVSCRLTGQEAASPVPCQGHESFCFPRPWELLLCSSCAAEGTHRCCSNVRTSRTKPLCSRRAGGTA